MGKTLYVTDFDDTLAQTDAQVHLTKADGKKVILSPEKYAVYDAEEGDQFDFSEFEQLKNPRPINRFVNLLKKVLDDKKADKVAVLTARGHTKPIKLFLEMMGIKGNVSIAALGDANPQRKANYIEKHIQQGYTRVAFIDDSEKNVKAVNGLKDKYPQAKILVHHVKHTSHSEAPASKRQVITQLLNSKVRNPDTDNDILVKTALKYDKSHPAYRQAHQMVQSYAQKHNIKLRTR